MADMTKIEAGYKAYHHLYDNALSSQGILMKLYNQIIWGINDADYTERVLSFLPNTFFRHTARCPCRNMRSYIPEIQKNAQRADYSAGLLR